MRIMFFLITLLSLACASEEPAQPFEAEASDEVSFVQVATVHTDTLRQSEWVKEIILRMPWMDSIQTNIPKLCFKVLDYFDIIKQDVEMKGHRYEANDPVDTELWQLSLLKTTARFLRYSCYDTFSGVRMGTRTEGGHGREIFHVYGDAVVLAYVLDH